ncbi:MAG: hypothetical protein ACJ8C4_04005 [Gemmataceae bacterium]
MKNLKWNRWQATIALVLLASVAIIFAMGVGISTADRATVRVRSGMTYEEAKTAIGCSGRYFILDSDLRCYSWKFDDKSDLTMWLDRENKALGFVTDTKTPFTDRLKSILEIVGLNFFND